MGTPFNDTFKLGSFFLAGHILFCWLFLWITILHLTRFIQGGGGGGGRTLRVMATFWGYDRSELKLGLGWKDRQTRLWEEGKYAGRPLNLWDKIRNL